MTIEVVPTVSDMVNWLQEDLKNERKHMNFYIRAAACFRNHPLRPEMKEFFQEESRDELKHVEQFSEQIVLLGSTPLEGANETPIVKDWSNLNEILDCAIEMEEEVAKNYARRVKATDELENATMIEMNEFYIDQLRDSWRTAKELQLWKRNGERSAH